MAMVPRRSAIAVLVLCLLSVAVPARAAGGLALVTKASTGVTSVGEKLRYTVTVENTGDDVIRSVTVRTLVDDDLEVVSVPIHDRVLSAGLSDLQGSEEIFWTIKRLLPAEKVTLVWKAKVVKRGDGRVDATVTAEGSDGSRAEASSTVYVLLRRCFLWHLARPLT